jgi:lysophospholipase L1-like esterase
VATLVALLAAELGARLLVPLEAPFRMGQFTEIVKDRHQIDFPDVFAYDRERFWGLAPDSRLPDDAWPLFGRIANRQGVREDREIPARKAADEIRVLFLGDSTTFGYGVPLDETLVAQTERLLARQVPGRTIECVNAGVPGYTLFQGWRTLIELGFDFDPDLVVLSFGWNELAEWDGVGDLRHYRELMAATPPGPLRYSRLLDLAWRAMHPFERADVTGGRPRLFPYEFRFILEQIAEATEQRGVDLLLLVWPSSENIERDYRTPLQEEQFRFGVHHGLGGGGQAAVLDGIAVMRTMAREYPRSALYIDPIHATELGYRGIAQALATKIATWIDSREPA